MEELIFENFNTENAEETLSERKLPKIELSKIKSEIYTTLYYTFGLFAGAYLYKITQSEAINNLIKPVNNSLLNLFVSDFALYFSIFLIVVFLGFCLIGYPIINIIPTVIGLAGGIKMGYFLINYSVKGIGYSLIMIVPHIALFLTVISYTIQISSSLSKSLIDLTKSNAKDFSVKPYVKKYLIMAVCVLITAIIDAGLSSLLFSVVTI